ncbi:MAG: ThuA domain-containing protein [Verrucomicrobia bacterium]|nr:ThuA domain-containing protein [Verrucomicrobiota bacterium]
MTDVPGSQYAPDIVPRGQQVRWFTKNLSRKADITSITLESFDNSVAPTFVAITAEAGDVVKTAAAASSAPTASAQPKAQSFDWGQGVRTLLVGGGSSHDFQRWFRLADLATLQESKGFSAHYTEQYADVPSALQQIDVLCWSANQPQKDTGLRKAIMDFADTGKGLVLLHAGNWRLWNDWPEWNRILAGGGSQSHDRYGEFEVTSIDASHPVMKGVPASFRISDELYHHKQDADGAAAHPLATGRNLATGKTYPVVWITKHPKARIVNITLGHDGLSHDHPAYKALLKNALAWAAGKPVAAAQ